MTETEKEMEPQTPEGRFIKYFPSRLKAAMDSCGYSPKELQNILREEYRAYTSINEKQIIDLLNGVFSSGTETHDVLAIAAGLKTSYRYLVGEKEEELDDEKQSRKRLFEKSMERENTLRNIVNSFDWNGWVHQIPFIQWPPDWLVKGFPSPHTGMIGYIVTKKGKERGISVYLNCYELPMWGDRIFGENWPDLPFWEIHPYQGIRGETVTCPLRGIDDLIKLIAESLEEIE